MKEWIGEVVTTQQIGSFTNGTRFGVTYVRDLYNLDNLQVQLTSYTQGTAGFSVEISYDEFRAKLNQTLIPLYKRSKE